MKNHHLERLLKEIHFTFFSNRWSNVQKRQNFQPQFVPYLVGLSIQVVLQFSELNFQCQNWYHLVRNFYNQIIEVGKSFTQIKDLSVQFWNTIKKYFLTFKLLWIPNYHIKSFYFGFSNYSVAGIRNSYLKVANATWWILLVEMMFGFLSH